MKNLYRKDHTTYTHENELTGVDLFNLVEGGDSFRWEAWVKKSNGGQTVLLTGEVHGVPPTQAVQRGLKALLEHLTECAATTNMLITK